jgi:hypothetical protein
MTQVGQVLEDYTRWLNDKIDGDSLNPDVLIPDFLADYDNGKWLPNTPGGPGEAITWEFTATLGQGMVKFLRDEGFALPAGELVQQALGEAFANTLAGYSEAERETVPLTDIDMVAAERRVGTESYGPRA